MEPGRRLVEGKRPLAANAVDSAELKTGSIDTIHLGALQVTTAKINANAITAAKIAANAVGSSEIANNSVTTTQLSSAALSGKTMTGNMTLGGDVDLGSGTGSEVNVVGKMGIQDGSPPQKFHIDEVAGMDVGTGSSTSTAQFTLDSFTASVFRTAKYLVQITNSTDGDYQALEITLFHDGTTVYLTQYASIFDNGAQATFDADISSGNVRLRVTPASTDSMAYKFIRTTIEV